MGGEPDRDRDGEPWPRGEPDDWSDVDVDAAFAAIIAQYSEADPRIGPWPVVEDLDTGPAGPGPASSGQPEPGAAPSGQPDPGPASSGQPGPGPAGTSPAGTSPAGTEPSATGPAEPGPSAGLSDPVSATGRLGTPTRSGADDDQDAAPGPTSSRPSGDSEAWPGDVSSWPHDTRARQRRPGDLPWTYGTHDLHEAGPGETARRDRRPDTGDELPDRPGGRHVFDPVDGPEGLDDGFVPPVPPPLPRGDFLTTLAWVCVLGGPLFLLFAALAWPDIPGTLILAGVVAFIGGFVALVARMPNEHPDDPDDGAVV